MSNLSDIRARMLHERSYRIAKQAFIIAKEKSVKPTAASVVAEAAEYVDAKLIEFMEKGL